MRETSIRNDVLSPVNWLDRPIRDAALPPHMRQRALLAAQAANAIVRIRRKNLRRSRFIALSFAEQVKMLAESARVSLDPVLQWLNVPDLSADTPGYGRAVGKLGPRIGFSLRQAIAAAQIGMIGPLAESSVPALRPSRRRAKEDELTVWEAGMAARKRKMAKAERERWERVESEIRTTFRS
jgi:hypothetical protein